MNIWKCARAAWFGLAVLVAALSVAAGEKPEVTVAGPPPGWSTRYAAPVRLEVRDGRGELLSVMKSDHFEQRERIALSGAPSETVETTMLAPGSAKLEWHVAGNEGGTYVNSAYSHRAASNGTFLCVNGALYREMHTAIAASAKPYGMTAQAVPAASLPSRWQSYAGLSSSLIMHEADARALSRDQREALRMWLSWLGGRLWLIGADGGELLREWGWRPLGRIEGGDSGFSMGRGVVVCRESPEPEHILEQRFADADDLLWRVGIPGFSAVPMDLNDGLEGFSLGFIVACLAALGVLLGPGCYWFVKRRGNVLLFYLVAPLVALFGSLAIIAGTLLSEGGVRCNEFAVLYQNGNDAFMVNCYGVRPGLLEMSPSFSGEALPLLQVDSGWSGDVILETVGERIRADGLLRPRASCEYGVARPLTVRMDVTAEWDDAGCVVKNGLGYGLNWIVVNDGRGRTAWARNVPAGAERRLETSRVPEDVHDALGGVPGVEGWSRPVAMLAADAEELPYADDGGLGAGRLRARYYYVRVGAGEDGHE